MPIVKKSIRPISGEQLGKIVQSGEEYKQTSHYIRGHEGHPEGEAFVTTSGDTVMGQRNAEGGVDVYPVVDTPEPTPPVPVEQATVQPALEGGLKAESPTGEAPKTAQEIGATTEKTKEQRPSAFTPKGFIKGDPYYELESLDLSSIPPWLQTIVNDVVTAGGLLAPVYGGLLQKNTPSWDLANDAWNVYMNKIRPKLEKARTAGTADTSDDLLFGVGVAEQKTPIAKFTKYLTNAAHDAVNVPGALRMIGAAVGSAWEGIQYLLDEEVRNAEKMIGTGVGLAQGLDFNTAYQSSKIIYSDWWDKMFGLPEKKLAAMEDQLGRKVGRAEFVDAVNKTNQDNGKLLSSRMAYDALLMDGIHSEFVRRYQAGENPVSLASELENTVGELVFRSIIDPLNFIPMGGKAKDVAEGAKAFYLTPKGAGVAEGISRITQAGRNADDAIKLANAVADAADVSRNASKALAQPALHTVQDLVEHGLMSVTSAGKIDSAAGIAFDTIRNVADRVGPDRIMEVVGDWLTMVAKGGMPEGAVAAAKLADVKGLLEILTSEAGLQTANLAIDWLGGAEKFGTKNLENIIKLAQKSEDPTRFFVDKLMTELGRSAEKLYPSVDKRIKYANEINDLVKAGKNIPDNLSRYLVDGEAERFGKGTEYLIEINKRLQGDKGAVRVINKVLAGIYMGLNPAYAMRNALQNAVHMAVDDAQSFGYLGKRADDIAEKMGGFSYAATREIGGGPAATIETAKSQGFGAAKWSNAIERKCGKALWSSSVNREMTNAIKAASRGPEGYIQVLRDEKVPESIIKKLDFLLNETWDADKAIAAIYTAQIPNVSEQQLKVMRAMGIDQDVVNAYRNIMTLPEGQRAAAYADEMAKISKRLADEGYLYIGEELPINDAILAEYEKVVPGITDEIGALRKAEDSGEVIAGATDRIAKQVGATDEMMDAGRGAFEESFNTFTVGTGVENIKPANDIRTTLYNDIDKITKETVKAGKALLAKTFDDISNGVDRSVAWEKYFADRQKLWGGDGYIKLVAEKYQSALENIYKLNPKIDTTLYEQFYEKVRVASLWDNVDELYYARTGIARVKGSVGSDEMIIADALDAIMGGNPSEESTTTLLDFVKSKVKPEELTDNKSTLAFLRGGKKVNLDPVTANKIRDLAAGVDGAEVLYDATKAGTGKLPLIPPKNIPTNSYAKGMSEQYRIVKDMLDDVVKGQDYRWVDKAVDEKTAGALEKLRPQMQQKLSEAKVIASAVGNEMRDFALHNYNKRYGIDGLLSYVFPYQFWYTRTYAKWVERFARNPALLSKYVQYRHTLEKMHAGLPDWWKYQINTNELLGLNSESPIFFNLEATLNPLNGILGVDFNDPDRQNSGWFAQMVDNMGKLGPTVWTPLTIATGAALYLSGNQEGGESFIGRSIPITSTIKGATAMLGIKGTGNILTPGGLELDPFTIIQGGYGKYDRNRINRTLAAMVSEGTITAEQQVSAANPELRAADPEAQQIWNQAFTKMMSDDEAPWYNWRSFNSVLSGVFGVGFKGRTQADILADQFYNDLYALRAQYANRPSAEYTRAMGILFQKYPFGEGLLLGRMSGPERDSSLAYNVLGRIPPGATNTFAERAGIDARLINKFYEGKGHVEDWSTSDREQFMGGIIALATVLAVPADTIKAEWVEARARSSEMTASAEEQFGADIMDKANTYYDLKEDKLQNDYLDKHPEVAQYLDWRAQTVLRDPVLNKYYGGLYTLERWYESIRLGLAKQQFGNDIIQKYYIYNELTGSDRTAYMNDNPIVGEYIEWNKVQKNKIAQSILNSAQYFPDEQTAIQREDYKLDSIAAEDIAAGIQADKQKNTDAEATIKAYRTQVTEAGDFNTTQYIRYQSEKMWPGVMNLRAEYDALKKVNKQAAIAFWNAHPTLEMQDQYESQVYAVLGTAQKGYVDQTGNYVNYVDILGNELFRLVEDYIVLGQDVPQRQRQRIEQLTGMSFDAFVESLR